MKTKKSINYFELFSILGIALLSLLLWDTKIAYPIKIFIVLLHEISHAIMTILSGGSVSSIKLFLDLSGKTITNGGNPILIAASGYLGSLLFGSLLFLSAKYITLRKWVTSIISIILLLSAINLVDGGIQVFLCLVIALIFFLVPKYFNETITRIFLIFIGFTSCLYIIADIKQDLLTTTLRETDTQILEYLTGIPAIVIGGLWFIISLFTVLLIVRNMISQK